MGFKQSAECTENPGQATVEKVDVETVVEDKSREGNVVVEGRKTRKKSWMQVYQSYSMLCF